MSLGNYVLGIVPRVPGVALGETIARLQPQDLMAKIGRPAKTKAVQRT